MSREDGAQCGEVVSDGDVALTEGSISGGDGAVKKRQDWLRMGLCANVCEKMVFVLTRMGCLLRVHFSRHGVDTLGRGEVRQDTKKWLTPEAKGSINAPRD